MDPTAILAAPNLRKAGIECFRTGTLEEELRNQNTERLKERIRLRGFLKAEIHIGGSFTCLQTLGLINAPNLREVTGLENLETLEELFLQDNATLTTLAGLGTLRTLSLLMLRNNKGWKDIGALRTLHSLTTLDISGTGTKDLTPLRSLTLLKRLDISNLGKVSSVCPMEPLKDLLTLRAYNMTHVRGWGGLRTKKLWLGEEEMGTANTIDFDGSPAYEV